MSRLANRYSNWIFAFTMPVICLLSSGAAALAVPMPAEDDFNVVHWELRHIPGKWLYLTGQFFDGGLSREEEDERLRRFLLLSDQIRGVEVAFAAGDAEKLQALLAERDKLENDAEAIIEGRLTAVLEEAGLESSLPFFPDARWVFPPVDVEFDEPPRSLSISPRSRIELIERRPLRPGLSLDEAVEREVDVESAGDVAAIVGSLAGAATYPAIVAPVGDYRRLVSTVAHEWVHHYLFFKPLGVRYYDSIQLRTLNETVADVAGDALAALVIERFPVPGDASDAEPDPAPPTVDVDAFLRDLRQDVELLLTAGQIDVAEALMEERRLELAEQGVVFRRINQAFFAARGIYATSPGSVDPIGEQLRTLLAQTGGVGAFLRSTAEFRSVAQLDEALRPGS